MATYRCNSCQGTYQDVDDGDMTYYHACPPGVLNPRNENIDDRDANNPHKPKKEGRGRTKVEPAPVPT